MTRDEFLAGIHQWHRKPGASVDELRALEAALGRPLPSEYGWLLSWSNGGEGHLGGIELSLWPAGDAPRLNAGYLIQRYLPDVWAIGTDGGGVAIALDYATGESPALIRVPLGDLDRAAMEVIGRTLASAVGAADTRDGKE